MFWQVKALGERFTWSYVQELTVSTRCSTLLCCCTPTQPLGSPSLACHKNHHLFSLFSIISFLEDGEIISVCVCGCREETWGKQIFKGELWLRTGYPTETGHMLDIHLDWSVTVCSKLQYCPKSPVQSVCPPLPPGSLLFPSFNRSHKHIKLNSSMFFFYFPVWNVQGFWHSYCSNYKPFLPYKAGGTILFLGSKLDFGGERPMRKSVLGSSILV